MKHVRVRSFLAGASVCALLAGCTSEQIAGDVGERETEAAASVEKTLDDEHPGQTAVVLRWQKLPDAGRAKELRIVVENTTKEPQDVKLLLTGTPPSRQEVIEQEWTDIVLGAEEARTLSLPISNLPVQSTVHSAGLRVVASFTGVGSASATRRLAFSEPRTLTSAKDFKTVSVRTLSEQSRVHTLAANADQLLQSAGEVRVRNKKNGAFELANAVDARTGIQYGVLIERDVNPAEVEGTENDMHFPESETVSGDAGVDALGEEL